jgi:hypothetical protein
LPLEISVQTLPVIHLILLMASPSGLTVRDPCTNTTSYTINLGKYPLKAFENISMLT